KNSSQPKVSNSEPEGENAYASFQGLLALARITGSNADEAHGACKESSDEEDEGRRHSRKSRKEKRRRSHRQAA
ncbi:hypothetical protein CFOL_v3_21734, partial [Cephalotus follicularis]